MLVEEVVESVSILPDHLAVTVAGAPQLNARLAQVGLKELRVVVSGARLDAGATRPASLRSVNSIPGLRRRWEKLDLDEQRAILQTEIAHITIRPAATRGRRFDPSRVQITWTSDLLAEQRSMAWLSTAEAADRLGSSRQTILN